MGRRLGIEGPTLTHHLDRLANDGLIQRVRNPDDRRMYSVELTSEGRGHVERVEAHAVQLDQEFRSLFSPQEVAILFALLNRVRDHYCKESDVHAAR